MKEPFSRYVETATQVTRDTAGRIVRSFRKQGEAATENAQGLVDDLRERSQENREAIAGIVRLETKRVINAMGLATRDDVERLEQQILELRESVTGEHALEDRRFEAESPRGTREVAKKTAARRTAKKAESVDAPTATTATSETARQIGTAREATDTAAERTVPPGEATSSGESPPVPQPPVVDAESRAGEGNG
ncbi:MAG: phasin family protein [Actinomycetota bacterium]|nr:phasin family protein [Actinomycetota bacterium]